MLIRVKENRFVLVVDVVWPFFYKALVFKLLSSEGRFCHKFDAITEVVQLLARLVLKRISVMEVILFICISCEY